MAFRPPLWKVFVVIGFWTPTLQIKSSHIAAAQNVDVTNTQMYLEKMCLKW